MKASLSSFSVSPGSANYNTNKPCLTPNYVPVSVICFFKGSDTCGSCEEALFGDYYKSTSGKTNICFECFRRAYDPIRRTPCNFRKVRHCIAYHKHIDVENVVYHKMTSRQERRLKIMERMMYNKFGMIVDNKGKPSH